LAISSDAKTVKGEKHKVLTGIFYGAPANLSGYNVCAMRGNCEAPCLNLSGHGQFDNIQAIRIAKTRLLFEDRALFLACLRYDIETLIIRARNKGRWGWKPAVRINGTSDLPWLALMMATEFPEVQFYDYTKLPYPERRIRSNYWLTFSHDGNERNVAECMRVLELGINVCVVFGVKKGRPLPETWNGYRVIDGDLTDLRFRDGRGVVVGVRAKGRAKKTYSPFVVRETASNFVPLQAIKAAA
jgi:hypothetical protein